jgi:hypothetical protein
LETDVRVPLENKFGKKIFFLVASWKSLTKRAGSGSVPKCHGSGTLGWVVWV